METTENVSAHTLKREANEQAWLALEVALAGGQLWERIKTSWRGGTDDAFCRHVRAFLDALPPDLLSAEDCDFRRQCFEELYDARVAGHLTGALDPLDFARLSDGAADSENSLDLEREVLDDLQAEFQEAGFPHLGRLVGLRGGSDRPLLVLAVLHFYRRALLRNDAGSFGVPNGEHLTGAEENWARGLDELARALEYDGPWLEALLSDLADDWPEPGQPPPAVPEEATIAFNKGLAYFQQGKFSQAVVEFTAAVGLGQADAQIYGCRGEAHRLCGAHSQAVADLTEALRLDPVNTQVYLNRGLAYHFQGDYDQAVADFAEALRLDPHSAAAYIHRGTAQADRGDYDRAITDFSAAVRLAPGYFWAYHKRGMSYQVKGDYPQAVADFTQVLQLNPLQAEVFSQRGDAYRLLGDYDRAIADYAAALALRSNSGPVYASRGDAFRLKGEHELALADYTEALRLQPDNDEVYCNRGMIYRLEGMYDEALADLSEAIDLNSKNASAYHNRGKVYAALEDLERATSDYSEALWLHPHLTAAYLDRALAYYRLGYFPEAVDDCTRALRENTSQTAAYLIRGNAYAGYGRMAQVEADFSRAHALDRNWALVHAAWGVALTNQEKYDQAIAAFKEAIRLDPGDALVYASRSIAYQAKGEEKEAFSDLSRAYRLDAELLRTCMCQGLLPTWREMCAQRIADYAEGFSLKESAAKAPNAPVEVGPGVRQEATALTTEKPVSKQEAAPETNGVRKHSPKVARPQTETRLETSSIKETVVEVPKRQSEEKLPPKRQRRVPAEAAQPITPPKEPNLVKEPNHAEEDVEKLTIFSLQADFEITAESPSAAPEKKPPIPFIKEKAIVDPINEAEAGPPRTARPDASKLLIPCLLCGFEFVRDENPGNDQVTCPRCKRSFLPRSTNSRSKVLAVARHPVGRRQRALPMWMIWGTAAALLVAGGLLLRGKWSPRGHSSGAVQYVGAVELWRAYSDDAKAANKKYAGQKVQVQGTVEKVTSTSKGMCFQLKAPIPQAPWSIECHADRDDLSSKVREGETLKLIGKCESQSGANTNVKMVGCRVLSSAPAREVTSSEEILK